jgi:hypothetical protein
MAMGAVSRPIVLARYVLALERASQSCTRAEDRPAYGALLADAAGILAAAVVDGRSGDLAARVAAHDRLRGHLWLQDSVASAEGSAMWAQCLGAVGDATI